MEMEELQRHRNAALISSIGIRIKLKPFLRTPSLHGVHGCGDVKSTRLMKAESLEVSESSDPALTSTLKNSVSEEGKTESIDPMLTLVTSPFPGRRAVIVFTAVDCPIDSCRSFNEESPTSNMNEKEEQGKVVFHDCGGREKREMNSPIFVYPSPFPCCLEARERGDRSGGCADWNRTSPSFFITRNVAVSRGESYVPTPNLTCSHKPAKKLSSSGGPYSGMTFVFGETAVPFTAVLQTLAHHHFVSLPPRRALLDHGWSLKWIKRPLPSDFLQVRPNTYQKLNHFPGSSILGRKDGLHRLLNDALAFLRDNEAREAACNPGCDDPKERNTASTYVSRLFPQGFLLPQEQDKLEKIIHDPVNKGKLYIVKPTTAACGRGIFLLECGPNAKLPSPEEAEAALLSTQGKGRVASPSTNSSHNNNNTTTPSSASRSSISSTNASLSSSPPSRENGAAWIVQEYMDRPFLAHGYKFDLRLYVVVTSYQPLRVYVYKEGLVRFATTPYYQESSQDSSLKDGKPTMASPDQFTAHLTNFTINKKSEDYVVPSEKRSWKDGTDVDAADPEDTASKWCFSALGQYIEEQHYSWEKTWVCIQDLLAKVFLSVRPHVCAALEKVQRDIVRKNGRGEEASLHCAMERDAVSSSTCPDVRQQQFDEPPLTCHGVGPYFEIYGVDVLLQEPLPTEEMTGIQKQEKLALHPVLLEVNIMPSLSTHYSSLDQCIKGNFIADMLTLVGLTSTRVKSPPPISKPPIPLGNAFLDEVCSVAGLEAIFTAEEEVHRAPHFDPVFPLSSSSFAALSPQMVASSLSLLHLRAVSEGDITEKRKCHSTSAAGSPPKMLEHLLHQWFSWKTNQVNPT